MRAPKLPAGIPQPGQVVTCVALQEIAFASDQQHVPANSLPTVVHQAIVPQGDTGIADQKSRSAIANDLVVGQLQTDAAASGGNTSLAAVANPTMRDNGSDGVSLVAKECAQASGSTIDYAVLHEALRVGQQQKSNIVHLTDARVAHDEVRVGANPDRRVVKLAVEQLCRAVDGDAGFAHWQEAQRDQTDAFGEDAKWTVTLLIYET